MKTCRVCQVEKPYEAFSKHPIFKDGRNSRCKACKAASERERLANLTPEERRAQNDRRNAMRRDTDRKRKFGLTREAYDLMVEQQENACALCGDPLNTGRRAAPVDHDHATGEVRGILCAHCNLGLGHFRDDVERLKKAIMYLEK